MKISDPILFEAPLEQTLFILEAGKLRIITFNGGEALLAIDDFLALLPHVPVDQTGEIDFTFGETLFLFAGDVVQVFGLDGTEATFAVADLEAFATYLASHQPKRKPRRKRD